MLWVEDLVVTGFNSRPEAEARRLVTEFNCRLQVDLAFVEYLTHEPVTLLRLPSMVESRIETLPTGAIAHSLRFEAEVSEMTYH